MRTDGGQDHGQHDQSGETPPADYCNRPDSGTYSSGENQMGDLGANHQCACWAGTIRRPRAGAIAAVVVAALALWSGLATAVGSSGNNLRPRQGPPRIRLSLRSPARAGSINSESDMAKRRSVAAPPRWDRLQASRP